MFHIHPLFRIGSAPIATVMQRMLKCQDKYIWCDHSTIIGKRKRDWQNIDYVLALFSDKKRKSRQSTVNCEPTTMNCYCPGIS